MYTIRWGPDSALEGLDVHARAPSVGALRAVSALADITPPLSGEDLEHIVAAIDVFAAALIAWNLQDGDGNPIPATRQALEEEDPEFVLEVMREWLLAKPPAPPEPDPVIEMSLPMQDVVPA